MYGEYLCDLLNYHILVDKIAKMLPCDKTLSFVNNNYYFAQFNKRVDKAS